MYMYIYTTHFNSVRAVRVCWCFSAILGPNDSECNMSRVSDHVHHLSMLVTSHLYAIHLRDVRGVVKL